MRFLEEPDPPDHPVRDVRREQVGNREEGGKLRLDGVRVEVQIIVNVEVGIHCSQGED